MTGVVLAVLIFSLAQTVLLSEDVNHSITTNSSKAASVDPAVGNGTPPSDKKVNEGTPPSDKKVDEGTTPSKTEKGKGTQTLCNTTGNGTQTLCNTTVNGTQTLCNTTVNGTQTLKPVMSSARWEFLNLKNLTLEHGITFAAGAGLSAIVCSACCCVIGLCSRRNRRKRRDEDKEYPGAALTMVASVDRQRSGSAGLAEDEQAPLRTGGEQGEGGAAGGANADVDYATIDVSQLKKREAADEPGPGADTDYAEIRKERKGGGDRGEGEGEGEGEGGEEAAAAAAAGVEGAAEIRGLCSRSALTLGSKAEDQRGLPFTDG